VLLVGTAALCALILLNANRMPGIVITAANIALFTEVMGLIAITCKAILND
jgi:hypothetical protein